MGVELIASFAFTCPKCGAVTRRDVDEVRTMKVRPGVYHWVCQVCEYEVEESPIGSATRKPIKWKKPTSGKGAGK